MMRAIDRIRGFCCGIFLLASLAQGLDVQAQAGVQPGLRMVSSTRQIALGEPFTLKIEAAWPAGAKSVTGPAWPDTLAHFELLQPVQEDSATVDGMRTRSRVYRLTSFDSGRWAIPVLVATAGGKTYRSDTLSILVTTVPIEGNAYRDLHEIIEVAEPPFPWKRWAAIGFGLLLLAVLAWYFYRKRRRPVPVVPAFDTRLSPLDQALASLKAIREADLLGKGEVKGYYSRLTDTFRLFATRRFEQPLLAETTDGILLHLSRAGVGRDALSALAAMLRLADAVKFAKYVPPAEDARQAVDDMEALIKDLNPQKPTA